MDAYKEEIINLHIDHNVYKKIEEIADNSFISPSDVILQAINEFLNKDKE